MSSIPNVSEIYRDLTRISTPHSNYQHNPHTQIEHKYADKQRRHNELLGRFQDSYQHQRSLVGVGYSQHGAPNYQKYDLGRTTSNERWDDQGSCAQSHKSTGFGLNRTIPNSNYVIPKIRYRHIEDQQRKQSESETSPILENTLQRQFYGEGKAGNRKQYDTESEMGSAPDNHKNMGLRMNRTTDYQETLESYYNLCRKNLSRREELREGQPRFIRTSTKPSKTMKLDDALKILSSD